jgi:hypothetical protein
MTSKVLQFDPYNENQLNNGIKSNKANANDFVFS